MQELVYTQQTPADLIRLLVNKATEYFKHDSIEAVEFKDVVIFVATHWDTAMSTYKTLYTEDGKMMMEHMLKKYMLHVLNHFDTFK